MIHTNEGAMQYEHSLNHFLEFFSKAGSLFDTDKKLSYYGNETTALTLFQQMWIVDKVLSFKLLLWLRDCRGGAGNRSGFRSCLNWVANREPEWVKLNIDNIISVGRWDDLTVLFNTEADKEAANAWAKAIKERNVLAAKWADRKMTPIKHALGIRKEGDFRKLLASIRSSSIVEHKMTFKHYDEIEYPHVPSVAMARYSKAFTKNDSEHFAKFQEDVKANKVKINTSVLFPHDCIRTALSNETETANLQFDNLPNYIDNTKERIMVLADSSGSMNTPIAGSTTALQVCMGLALYCSDKVGKDNPFYRKFIGFESESEFKIWRDLTFSEAVNSDEIFDGACGSTRVDLALNLILKTAKMFNLTSDQIPTALLIISDMQFSDSVVTDEIPMYRRSYDFKRHTSKTVTPINKCLAEWEKAGYNIPKIIYWNMSGYMGSPDTDAAKNVAMISGFSPAILTSIFKGEEITPMSILYKSIEKYKINIPGELVN